MSNHSLLILAEESGVEARAQRDDLRSQLFPTSRRPPTERMVAGLRQWLAGWVSGVESALIADEVRGQGGAANLLFPVCWKALTMAGLLSDDLLLGEAQAQMFLADLHGPDTDPTGHDMMLATLGRMVADENTLAANAAQMLLSAHLRLRSSATPSIAELPAATLSLLAWRVVAAHEVLAPGSRERMAPRVADLLAAHDESARIAAAAERTAHHMFADGTASANRPELWPERQGLPLTLGLLSVCAELPFAYLLDLAQEAGAPRLALVLRALDYEPREAKRLIAWLAARTGGEQPGLATIDAYNATGQELAKQSLDRMRAQSAYEAAPA